VTLVLLVGSGLLARSFARMVSADLGFSPEHVMTFRLTLPRSSYGDEKVRADFEQRLLTRLSDIPGVVSAGSTSHLPIAAPAPGTAYLIDGRPVEPGQLPPMIHYTFTAPGFFESLQMRLQRGRLLEPRDRAPEARSIVINRAMADKFWPGEDPLGKRVRPSGSDDDSWYTIVGVVAPVLHNGVREPAPTLIYYPPDPDNAEATTMTYVVRGRDRLPDAAAVRAAVWGLDASLPLALMQPLEDVVARSFVQFTFTALTLGIAALTGLLLGAVGLYGVLSYAVTLRTRDIGVRLALGASPGAVMRSVVLQGLAVAAIGLAVGLAAAAALTRLLAGLLYDVTALDLPTFATMSAALLLVALFASFLPARRAASVSPLESLRAE
jgi:putative ABC transport system permease protein